MGQEEAVRKAAEFQHRMTRQLVCQSEIKSGLTKLADISGALNDSQSLEFQELKTIRVKVIIPPLVLRFTSYGYVPLIF